MSFVKQLFASDAVKQCLAAVAVVAGVLAVHLPPGALRTIAGTVVAVLASLGIISGGTTGTQPAAVWQALGQGEPRVTLPVPPPPPPPPKGFARTDLLLCLVTALGALALGCATMATVSGSTGTVELGKGYRCSAAASETNRDTCTKLVRTSCTGPNGFANETQSTLPIPKDASGVCP